MDFKQRRDQKHAARKAGAADASQTPAPPIAKRDEEHAYSGNEYDGSFPRLTKWKPVIDLATFAVLFAYTTIAAFQYRSMERSVDISRRVMEMAEQPSLIATGFTRNETGPEHWYELHFTNFGKGVASDVGSDGLTGIAPDEMTMLLPLGPNPKGPGRADRSRLTGSFAPGEPGIFRLKLWTDSEFSKIKAKELFGYTTGRINYRDRFGIEFSEEYCFSYVQSVDSFMRCEVPTNLIPEYDTQRKLFHKKDAK